MEHPISPDRTSPFLTIDQASEYLQIPKGTLYSYTHRKLIPHFKVRNRRLYFRRDDLDQFILNEANRVASQEEVETQAATFLLKREVKRG